MPASPKSLGYRMPAEWEEHEATWLAWPKNTETFSSKIMGDVEKSYVKIVNALADGEEVRMLVDDERTEGRVRSMIERDVNVGFYRIRTADVWTRDYCPVYVSGSSLALTKWTFNAWGEKYEDLRPDDEAGMAVAQSTGLLIFHPGMVLEGGSIDVNGRGSLITTEQCLLNPNRNHGMTKLAIERNLGAYLGVDNFIWLKSGIAGDDTDGHVDALARFVDVETIVCAREQGDKDENHEALEANFNVLKDSTDKDGERFEIIELPMPREVKSPYGRLPASYANFYIGNAVVLVPTFDCPADAMALSILRRVFPTRRVVGVDCTALLHGLGTIHCVTQQVPRKPYSILGWN